MANVIPLTEQNLSQLPLKSSVDTTQPAAGGAQGSAGANPRATGPGSVPGPGSAVPLEQSYLISPQQQREQQRERDLQQTLQQQRQLQELQHRQAELSYQQNRQVQISNERPEEVSPFLQIGGARSSSSFQHMHRKYITNMSESGQTQNSSSCFSCTFFCMAHDIQE